MSSTGGISFNGTGKVEFKLSHSDGAATYRPVADADVQGVAAVTSGIVLALKAAHPDPSVTRVGYVGNRRFIKLLADFSGTLVRPRRSPPPSSRGTRASRRWPDSRFGRRASVRARSGLPNSGNPALSWRRPC